MNKISKHIVFIAPSYYPSVGGIQEILKYEAEGLASRGYFVNLITCSIENCDNNEIINGVNIRRYLFKELKTLDFNVLYPLDSVFIVIYPEHKFCFTLMSALNKTNFKKIVYFHGMRFPGMKKDNKLSMRGRFIKFLKTVKWKAYNLILIKKIKDYDYIVHLHEKDTGYLYCNNFYPDKTVAIYNCVNECELSNIKLIPYTNREKRVIFVGNYGDRKNQKILLKEFYLSEIDKEFELIMIGSEKNTYYNELIQLKNSFDKEYGRRNVRILYGLKRCEMLQILSKSKLFVLPSKDETFPIVLLEAMYMKVPFLSVDVGVVSYLPGGIIVKNYEDLRYWIFEMIKSKKYSVLGEIGREFYDEKCSNKVLVDKIEMLVNG